MYVSKTCKTKIKQILLIDFFSGSLEGNVTVIGLKLRN